MRILLAFVLLGASGCVASGGSPALTRAGESGNVCEPACFCCPFHTEVVSNRPGACPKCGCAYVASIRMARVSRTEKGPEPLQEIIKIYTCPLHAEIVSLEPGTCPRCGLRLEEKMPPTGAVYACPVHPTVISGTPGTCPRCGLRLERRDIPPR